MRNLAVSISFLFLVFVFFVGLGALHVLFIFHFCMIRQSALCLVMENLAVSISFLFLDLAFFVGLGALHVLYLFILFLHDKSERPLLCHAYASWLFFFLFFRLSIST